MGGSHLKIPINLFTSIILIGALQNSELKTIVNNGNNGKSFDLIWTSKCC